MRWLRVLENQPSDTCKSGNESWKRFFLRYVIRKRFTKYLPRYVLKDLLDTFTAARITINGD